MQTLKKAPQKPPILTFTLIPSSFFLRSLCKIVWMNVHYFPNAPRISMSELLTIVTLIKIPIYQSRVVTYDMRQR